MINKHLHRLKEFTIQASATPSHTKWKKTEFIAAALCDNLLSVKIVKGLHRLKDFAIQTRATPSRTNGRRYNLEPRPFATTFCRLKSPRGLIISLFILVVVFCIKCSKEITGTTTETTTGCSIEGLVRYNDSEYVSGADVILHDQRLVKNIALAKRTALIRSGNTETNINGFFHFDSVDTGVYLVEINDHDTLGMILEAHIDTSDTLVEAKGVVKRTGCIIGKVDTSIITEYTEVSIYLPEIDVEVSIDRAGNFMIKNIPNWNYIIHVSIKDTIVALPDESIVVPVTPGDTTRILQLGAETGTVIIDSKIIENPHSQ